MSTPTQEHRQISVKCDLGGDVLLFRRMQASEPIGRLFRYALDLFSEDNAIEFDDVLGTSMTVQVELPSGAKRHFNGFPSYFAQIGRHGRFATYHAVLRPWPWFLTRSADCRIFQDKSVPEIIKEIFKDGGFQDFSDKTNGNYGKWDYCVQYRESHFDFVSRLMEHEGIYYFFEHEENKHTLVMADDYGAHDTAPDYAEIPYFPPDEHQRRVRDHISDLAVLKQVQTGTYILDDYDFKRPKVGLLAKSSVSRKHKHSEHKVYDYPGEFVQAGEEGVKSDSGDAFAKVRIEELQAGHERVRGGGDVQGLCTGALFELTGFPRDDQNREYLVVDTDYTLESDDYETGIETRKGTTVQCRFEAIDAKQPYRSPRTTPRPIVQGPQTAPVVGPKNQEIFTDKFGRVKVQFRWDRYGKMDENSSCWIRVSQAWAGRNWGAIHIPRIGQEVVIDFLEGDPDRPIITGRVYNAEQMPPYALNANQTQSGIKSRSTMKGKADNFNELRFEDKMGEEEIYFHAERDFKRVVENDDALEVGKEKKDPGNQTIDIYNDRTVTIEKGNDKLGVDTGNRTATIKGDDDLTLKSGNRTVKINAGKSLTQAAQSITLKVGGSSIKLEPAKITLKSPMIVVQGSATVDVKSPMTTVKGNAMLTLKGGVVMIN